MLTRETVENIVECRLPESQIICHLEALSTVELDTQTMRTFIDVLFATLDQPSRRLQEIIGALDCSGTGGSGLPHFNTSTTVAFVLAAGGLKVAKFGNRAALGQCGSFDLLDALEIPAHTPPEAVPQLLADVGLAFLFAPQYYPGLAKLAPIRRSIGKRTIFNSIGPLLNPVRPYYRVMGVSCPQSQKLAGEYLSTEKSNRRSLIVRSETGLDELEPGHRNLIVDSMQGYVTSHDLYFAATDAAAASAGDGQSKPAIPAYTFSAQDNYRLFLDTIDGVAPQAVMDIVCLNAAAGFVASGFADLTSSIELSRELLTSGQVKNKVEQCRRAYAKLATR
jgi:anthranilate phosphoribosyltransferase